MTSPLDCPIASVRVRTPGGDLALPVFLDLALSAAALHVASLPGGARHWSDPCPDRLVQVRVRLRDDQIVPRLSLLQASPDRGPDRGSHLQAHCGGPLHEATETLVFTTLSRPGFKRALGTSFDVRSPGVILRPGSAHRSLAARALLEAHPV